VKSSLPRRRLIPRWRPTSQTLKTSEIASTLNQPSAPLRFDHQLFDESVAAWRAQPTAGHLADVIAFSADADLHPKIADLVREAQTRGFAVSPVQQELFREVVDDTVQTDESTTAGRLVFQSRVADLRRELLVAPENLLALLDLAQLQLAAGKVTAAERLLKTALGLAPNGRIVLRTAARFYVHLGKFDKAHQIITRHPGTKKDPWLMASEIALADAAGVHSSMASQGLRLIKEAQAQPWHLAEVAGALANSEMMAGRFKEARQLLRKALLHPTDNIVAQAVMDGARMGFELDEPTVTKAVKRSSEAQLLQAWQNADEEAAELHALQWHAEEPFSSRPIQFLTTLYSLQSQYEKSLGWVRRGLVADPSDEGLIANLAFAKAAVGDVQNAELAMNRIKDAKLAPYLKATEGLIALKRGDFAKAEALYREAEQGFDKLSRPDLAALAIAYYAKFAVESDAPDSARIRAEAEVKFSKARSIDGHLLMSRLVPSTTAALMAHEPKRRLTQWVYDSDSNTLTERHGVTAKGAPSIVVAGRKGSPTPRR
jgi:Flp pilus assembly protein TadD